VLVVRVRNHCRLAIVDWLTLKAFANFSPGFALKPWVYCGVEDSRNPDRVAN